MASKSIISVQPSWSSYVLVSKPACGAVSFIIHDENLTIKVILSLLSFKHTLLTTPHMPPPPAPW